MAWDEVARNNLAPADALFTATGNGRCEIEEWLNNTVACAYDAMQADPSRAVSVNHVRARLSAAHKSAQKAG